MSSDLQTLRERLELESTEVLRLRGVVAALQQDKLALSEVGGGILSVQEGRLVLPLNIDAAVDHAAADAADAAAAAAAAVQASTIERHTEQNNADGKPRYADL